MTSTAPALGSTNSSAPPEQRSGQPSSAAPGSGHRRRALVDVSIGVAYVAFAAWLTLGLWPDPDTRTLALNPPDQILYEWFLAHDTTLWSGDFSLVSDRLNAPYGVNLLANTTVIALGGLFAPITAHYGAATTFSLLIAFNLALTAISWYVFLRRTLRAGPLAAGVGAAFCGFAPGMVSQSNSHLHMTAQFLIPLMLWCVVELARAARQPVPAGRRMVGFGVLFGTLVGFQLFIGEETLFLTAITLMIFTVVYAARTRPALKELGRFAAGVAVAVGTAVALLGYPLWTQFKGPQSVSDGVFSPHYFSADLAGFAAFSPLTLAGDGSASSLTTGPAEYNTFLGWPLLVLVAVLLVWLRRDAVALACGAAALAMSLLSLGPELIVAGHRTGVPGPFWLLLKLPVVDGALPMRFALAAIPLVALLLVRALEQARQSTLRQVRIAVPVLVGAALLPLVPTPLPTTDRAPVSPFFTEGLWRQCATDGQTIVTVPLPTPERPEPMRNATAAQTAFALPEGFFIGPYGKDGHATMGIGKLPTSWVLSEVIRTGIVPKINDDHRLDARKDLTRWKAACVVLTPNPRHEELKLTLEQLLGPGTPVEDVIIWPRRW
ncbi:glycosyl transferase [Catellatospora sp. TT07R-123]|uniref:hypothetical protein n=1 Tax=Catellatospora sp. TT07R-123 TaxID=2733863 RepID=UPI001B01E5A2|nr:hypothetical protein [Catellatospora sp. TT07R-123]GHJ45982.1 glycosyl transferase [Catellatospora sp. TT07R-123]